MEWFAWMGLSVLYIIANELYVHNNGKQNILLIIMGALMAIGALVTVLQ